MSDNPYAQFGVHNAVLTGDTIEDHQQNMLELDVAARDGDDAITLHEDAGVQVTDLVDDELNTDDRIEINVPTDGEFNEQADQNEGDEVADEGDAEAFEPLGDIPDELTQTSNQISEYADGFQQMKAQAVERGLSAEMAARVESEYEADGELSEESLKALEEAGYGRGFVQAYIKGQESLAEQYVAKIMDFAGGKDAFNRVLTHMQANSPDALEALEEAIQRQDIKAVKTTINLAMASQTKKFGKAPARNVNARAPASAPRAAAPVVEGYANTDAMVAAMSDRRYQTDAKYRAAVQAKVAASNW
ncbi:head assembly [Pseudomonas phage Pf-10]|uniref:Capsid assembly protein n=1 Tax=Pseudomonas phage Pf-10 TaxID=1562076 RepID=A0A0A0YRY5_9CAUD|nr:head assembly [Pseudomonas phage Pf-10]AIX12994.1 capsid assembly protein [Pseudomonas phage Pf-10]